MIDLAVGAVAALAVAPVLRGAVVRYAVPREEPPLTACPACGRAVRALAPTGRCPGCGGRIGPGGWQVEVVAMAVVCAVLRAAHLPDTLLLLWAGGLGVVLAFVDGAVRRLPDALTLLLGLGTSVLLVAAALSEGTPGVLLRCLSVALAAGLLFDLPTWFGLMGGGDVKLALGLGALLGRYGWATAFSALFLASALGGLWAVGLAAAAWVRRRPVRGLELPFGPFMLLGTLVAALAG